MALFRREQNGMILGEIIISVIVVASLVYIAYMVSENISKIGKASELKTKALYVAKLKMEKVKALNFDNLESAVGCEPVGNVVGMDSYMPATAQVCVNVIDLNWDSLNDVDGKKIEVTVTW